MNFFSFFLDGVKGCLAFEVIAVPIICGIIASVIIGCLSFFRGV